MIVLFYILYYLLLIFKLLTAIVIISCQLNFYKFQYQISGNILIIPVKSIQVIFGLHILRFISLLYYLFEC